MVVSILEPREFLMEDRLEKFRLQTACNMGESGVRNFSLGELLENLELDSSILKDISLSDSPNQGRTDLREEIASLYEDVHPDEVLITTGTSEALFIIFHILLEKGDRVGLFLPAFQSLYEIPVYLGAATNGVFLKNRFKLQELLEMGNKLTIINHPHNPTGLSLEESDIALLNDWMTGKEQFLLFDEHYRFLDLFGDLIFSGMKPNRNILATGSITKCFGVVGLRIGWLVGNKKFISKARAFKDYVTHTVNPISEFLTLKILQKRHKLIAPIKMRIQNNIAYLQKNIQHITSIQTFIPPQAGLICFPELHYGINSEEYCNKLMENCDIFVLPGSNFEAEGFIRIGFGETENRFRAGVDRWVEWENPT